MIQPPAPEHVPTIAVAVHARDRAVLRWLTDALNPYLPAPEPQQDTEGLAAVLCRPADVVVLDGHGYPHREPPIAAHLEITPDTFRRTATGGITAPVLLVGACHAAGPALRAAFQRCLARDQVVLVGSTQRTHYTHATRVYPRVIESIASLGPDPDPAAAYRALRELDILAGHRPRGWTAVLLNRTANEV